MLLVNNADIMILFVVLVDALEAGAGNLEVVVRSTKTGLRVPHFLEADDISTGLFQIRFSPPHGCFRYQIDVSFNDWPVDGESASLVETNFLQWSYYAR